jgi:chromosome segregation ATPase
VSKGVPSIEELEAKLETFQEGLENAWDAIDDLEAKLEEEREERRCLEKENQNLQKEIDRLDARTDLLSLVENSDDMTARQRRITLIQHLKKAAEKERERGRDAKASVNKEEAEAALQYPDIDRTTIYDDLRKAPNLVGKKSVLRYESSSGGNSRLKLNLEKDDLSTDIVDHARRNGGE